jgi:hypothetical protein
MAGASSVKIFAQSPIVDTATTKMNDEMTVEHDVLILGSIARFWGLDSIAPVSG